MSLHESTTFDIDPIAMKPTHTFLSSLLLLLVPLTLAASPLRGDDDDDELELETVRFFIELNETDVDVGVQCELGGEPYRSLKAFRPGGQRILNMRPQHALLRQGMSDFFFESAEPELDEVSIDEFLERFPEGEYEFETITLEGEEQDGEAGFTHDMPAGPVILSPLDGSVVSEHAVVVAWEPVTMTSALFPPQRPVNIVGYEVIVTREDPLRDISIDVGPDVHSVPIPAEFLDQGTEYEVEVLAIEETDNQTISIVFFETAE